MGMLRSIGKQSGESMESVLKKTEEAMEGRICGKGRSLSLEWNSEGVTDDESGESIEEKVPVIGTGELESWKLV